MSETTDRKGGGAQKKSMANDKKTVRYISKYLNLRIVVKPARYEIVDGVRNLVPGKDIRFVDGVYETSDPEEVKFLDEYVEKNKSSNVVTRVKVDAVAERADMLKTLEEREAELAERERKLAEREKRLERYEAGSGDESPYEKMSKQELQDECKKRGLPTSGNKTVLSQRLVEDDEKKDGGEEEPAY